MRRLELRHRRGRLGRLFNYLSIAVAGLALVALFFNVVNQAFGTIGLVNSIEPARLTTGRLLEELSNDELALILAEHVSGRLRVLIRDTISRVDARRFTKASVAEIVADPKVDPAIAGELIKNISPEQQAALLADYADQGTLRQLVMEEVVEPQVIASFPLAQAIFNFNSVKAEIEGPILDAHKRRYDHDDAKVAIIRFHSWLDSDFLTNPMSSTPALAGVRTALIGSLGLMATVVLVALPVGVGAAIYLEEYARHGFVNRLIETNVRNLAGVPSIIYGMLGLAIFVRALAPFTSGMIFGYNVSAPTLEAVIERIAPAFDDAIAIEDGVITSQSEIIDAHAAERIANVFRHFGTPSLTMHGNSSVRELSNALAAALDINVETVESRAGDERAIERRGKYFRFDLPADAPVSRETYTQLLKSLARINSFSPNGRYAGQRRLDPGAADLAHHRHQRAGGHSRRALHHSRGVIWFGRDPLADDLAPGAARRPARHHDRHNPVRLARGRGDGAADRRRRGHLPGHRPQQSLRPIHSLAHSDLSMDGAPASAIR